MVNFPPIVQPDGGVIPLLWVLAIVTWLSVVGAPIMVAAPAPPNTTSPVLENPVPESLMVVAKAGLRFKMPSLVTVPFIIMALLRRPWPASLTDTLF